MFERAIEQDAAYGPTFVGIGKLSDPRVLLAVAGLLFTAVLMARRIAGAILLGVFVIAVAGIPFGLAHWPVQLFSLPHPSATLLKLDLRSAAKLGLGELVFVFFFVDLFDNVGTLVGTMAGALTGTSTVTSYVESAAGVAAGGRTGLGNIVIAALFLAAAFCAPIVAAVPSYATAPALILVGALMCGSISRVSWGDFTEAFPAFLTILATPLTFSIATGLSLGLLSPLIWVLSALFLCRYAFLGTE
jgi:AGZA family xanthine/uracil permease-like MFS transporter